MTLHWPAAGFSAVHCRADAGDDDFRRARATCSGPRRQVGSPDHEREGETVLPSPQTQLADHRQEVLSYLGFTICMPSLRSHRRCSTSLGERRGGEGFAAIPLVNLSKPMSCLRDLNARLVVPPFRKHTPCNAGQLVGQRGGQHVVMQSLSRRGEPRTEAMLWPTR